MQSEQRPSVSLRDRVNFTMNVLFFACDVLSLPLLVLLHRRLGSRRVGLAALLVLIVIPLWACSFPAEDPAPMLGFLVLFVLACFCSRLNVLRRAWRGDTVHRYSDGEPRLARWLPRQGRRAANVLQAILILAVGLLLQPVSEGLGTYLAAAAVARLVVVVGQRMALNERLGTLRDQFLEQQFVNEQYRRIGGR